MGITVAQALKIEGLSQGWLLAGAQNLNNVIEYVEIIEVPYEPDWEAENYLAQVRTVEMLANNGCSALVFQPSVIGHLSRAVIQRADELGLPLIKIPESVDYSTIFTPLVGAILREKTFLLQRSQEIHRRLTDLILDGRGLPAIASALSELINRSVTITDAWGNVMAAANLEGSNQAVADILTIASRANGEWQTENGRWNRSGLTPNVFGYCLYCRAARKWWMDSLWSATRPASWISSI